MSERRPHILIVDDNSTNIDLLVATLRQHYRLGVAKSGPQALSLARRETPDLILLDIMMPEMDGFQVCEALRQDDHTSAIPVIFITALSAAADITRGFDLGAVDFITKPFNAAEVQARVRTHLALRELRQALSEQNKSLERQVDEKTAALKTLLEATLKGMALMVETRDPYTAGHQQRVAHLAVAMGRRLALPDDRLTALRYAALLHDIGKIRIPVSILNRTGKLMPAEMEMMKIHPQVGHEILSPIPFPWPVADIVLQHHEKCDGSGYPGALQGTDLLAETRVLTVADVVEAKSSYRPYRPALGVETALEEIERGRGLGYDPDAVDSCLRLFRQEGFTF
jgi:putative two-component system response regulator